MHPIVFQIGSFSLRFYGLMAACGFLAGALTLQFNRRFAKLNSDQCSSLLFVALIAGVVGARLFYVIQFYDRYFKGHWERMIRIDQGGLVFYGGFLLALVSVYLFCRKEKLDFVRIADVMIPSLCAAHLFGRVGCFLNGCCFGKPTTSFFGVHYPPESEAAFRYLGAAVHPVQLYEAAINLVLFGFFCWLLRHSRRGVVVSSYFILYGIIRFCDEFFRGDHTMFICGLTPAQVIGILLIPAGSLALLHFLKQEDHDAGSEI